MKILDIYTDGSHLKFSTGRLGIGGVLIDPSQQKPLGKKISEFGIELLPEYMKMSYGSGAENCSNPTAELTAVLVALQNFEQDLKGADIITIHADYLGVKEWMTGAWRVKEPYIARIKFDIDQEISRQGLKGVIQFAWVKGHQNYIAGDPDIHWNNYVDELAKKGEKK